MKHGIMKMACIIGLCLLLGAVAWTGDGQIDICYHSLHHFQLWLVQSTIKFIMYVMEQINMFPLNFFISLLFKVEKM